MNCEFKTILREVRQLFDEKLFRCTRSSSCTSFLSCISYLEWQEQRESNAADARTVRRARGRGLTTLTWTDGGGLRVGYRWLNPRIDVSTRSTILPAEVARRGLRLTSINHAVASVSVSVCVAVGNDVPVTCNLARRLSY